MLPGFTKIHTAKNSSSALLACGKFSLLKSALRKVTVIGAMLPLIVLVACASSQTSEAPTTTTQRAAPPPGASTSSLPEAEVTTPETTSPEQQELDAAKQQAIDECYAYARALVARDQKIERDRSLSITGTHSYTPGLSGSGLVGRMRAYGDENTFQRLYSSCMQSKGYTD